ncbi:unnamed protein product [Adineta ricciae]|uniref:Tudor domain-containing protein n=1 Tax=Adineta ricciae TaxID=249248 RepID=A0A815NK91_ADIRI|nr:unnamed protein product [Adineta ricciae]CAF1445983.1 unnamed protein product [Adineta ricciae]
MDKLEIPTLNHHVGSTERVYVAHVNDLNDFYLYSELFRDSLGKLGQELYDEYSDSLTKPLKPDEMLNVGDYCACPSESEDWYRGLIRQIDSNGHASVFKLDYGDVQCVPIQFLRPLHERYFVLNRLAFHCSLANLIKPIDGWPLDIVEEFRSRLTTTFLFAKFVNYNEIRDISEVEIAEKNSKIPINKDFERYQSQRPTIRPTDKHLYKFIPMEKLELNQSYQIRILYYISPSHFYVYLKEKFNAHTSFQTDLQQAVHDLRTITPPAKDQMMAVQDNHAIWHRAIITDINLTSSRICVFFTDIGQYEYTSIHNIRPLPEEFQRKPAFAIPCRLFNVCPMNFNEQSIWTSDDPVHDEITRLLTNNVTCKICAKYDQICYDIEIDIPKAGDLGTFLCERNLVARTKMHPSERSAFTSDRNPRATYIQNQLASGGLKFARSALQQNEQSRSAFGNNPNTMAQQSQMRSFDPTSGTITVSSTSNRSRNNNAQAHVATMAPQNGIYTILQVHSAVEFYGLSQNRDKEFQNFSDHLQKHYNHSGNDETVNVKPASEGELFVIQQDEKYHRVILKRFEHGSRVSVKLIDRGDEIIVDRSELLAPEKGYSSVPPFAVPLRLNGYDERQNSTHVTRNLKKLILNQHVHVQLTGQVTSDCYDAYVDLPDGQSVYDKLLSSDKIVTSPNANTKGNVDPTQHTLFGSRVFNNSNTRFPSTGGPTLSGERPNMGQRSDVLHPPPKLLTGAVRPGVGRFGGDNQASSAPTSSNEPMSRFSNAGTRLPQGSFTVESSGSKNTWNNDSNVRSTFNNNSNQQSFNRQSSGSSQFGNNQRQDASKTFPNNNQNRFREQQSSAFDQKRSSGSFQTYDNNEKQMSGGGFSQRNEGNTPRGGFSNRGGNGFADRRGHSGFSSRNLDRNSDHNNNESGSHFSGGFNRGGRERGRGGAFNRGDRDSHNENSTFRSQGFNNNRGDRNDGVFQNQRGGLNNRDGRGQRGGGFGSGPGSRGAGGRGGYRERDNSDLQLNSENRSLSSTNHSWSTMRSASANFEAGDCFTDAEVPQGTFKFVISHIESPNDFFIQLMSKADELSRLTGTLQTEFKQSPEASLSSFKVGQACLARSTDECWYRAIVLSTGVTSLKVRFIDFGDPSNVDSNSIRQLAKKYCTTTPYAYRCTFKNTQGVKTTSIESIIQNCIEKEYSGKIEGKTADGKYLLESDDFRKLLLDINAIKLKTEVTLKRVPCAIVHIEKEQQRFYIQDDAKTAEEIAELVEQENETAPILSFDEVKELTSDAVVLANFDDEPYRAIIASNASENDVNVCFIDFGNVSSCPKDSLKRCSESLSKYPPQSKECHLYGIPVEKVNDAFEYLKEMSDSDGIEYAVINQQDKVHNVILYNKNTCINEKFGYDPQVEISEKPSTTEVEEQKQIPVKAEIPTIENIVPTDENTSDVLKPAITDESETGVEETSSKYRQGILTHIEEDKPFVYIQLLPESDDIINKITELIETITDADQHESSYEIGSYVIAKFSVDGNFYRARIESHSATFDSYNVYFLDYGNIDENVPTAHLYPYSDELKQIEPQAHGYTLAGITTDTWNDVVQALLAEQLNEPIDFYIVDENACTIHVKIENEDSIYNRSVSAEQVEAVTIEPGATFIAKICATDQDYFYIHVIPNGNLHVCELEEQLPLCEKTRQDQWSIGNLCIVSTEENKFYRGEILSMTDASYDVKCIDYGNVLLNVTSEQLYVLPDEGIYRQSPLANQCRLHGIDDVNERKAIEEVIQHIQETEDVTIIVQSKTDDQCLLVILVRENKDVVNSQYLTNEGDDTKEEPDNIEEDEQVLLTSSDLVPTITDVQPENANEQSTSDEKVLEIASEVPSNNQEITAATENTPSDPAKNETDPPKSSD